MSKPIKGSATCADTICLSVLNPDSKPDANQPVFYLGEAAALNVRLVNATGSDITLKSGAALDIFFQSLNVDPGNCKINLPGWTLTPKQYSLNLAFSAASPATWGQGDANAITFQISGVQSSLTQATAGFFQINFSGLTGNNIPGRLKLPLSLIAAPQPGRAELDISVSLADEGVVYVSQGNDNLVENRLLLNIINKSAQAVFTGTPGHQGTPAMAVSFVYGSTAGALAPDADKSAPQTGSAWKITGKVSASEGNDWFVTDPDPSAKPTDPVWLLQPGQTNSKLIGTGDSAAVQFEFDHIISQTQPGVTLMHIQFSGFQKDDHTGYNDKLFVLPISKEYLPAPSLIRFSSEITKISINSSSQEVSIPLFWSMTGVSKIVLECSSTVIPNLPDVSIPYPGMQPPLQYDRYVLKFTGVEFSGSLLVTCRAYDVDGNDLNDLQQTITIDFPPVVTSYTGDIQADGSLLLKWTTEGAKTVTILSNIYAANGSTPIQPAFGQSFVDNSYFALTANGPAENSAPCVFRYYKKFGVIGSTISVGSDPIAIAFSPKGDYAFVVNSFGTTVTAIEIGSGPPFKALPTPITVGNNPWCITVSPKGDYAFVTLLNVDTVVAIEIGNGPPFQVVSQGIPVGSEPYGIAVLPKGDYVFVANCNYNSISVIEIGSGHSFQMLASIGVGDGPHCLAVSPKGDLVFVTCEFDETTHMIDIRTGPPFQVLPPALSVGDRPWSMVVSSKGDYVFVANYNDNNVVPAEIVDGPSFKVLPAISVPVPAAMALSRSGDHIFVVNDDNNTVTVIEIGDGPPFKVLSPPIGVGRSPGGVAVSPNGDFAFVTNMNDGTVSVIGPVSVSAF